MTTTYIAASESDQVCNAIEKLLSGSGGVVRVGADELGRLDVDSEDVLVVGQSAGSAAVKSGLSRFGLVQFAGCRPSVALLDLASDGSTQIAGISPVIAPRVANRVIGFTGPLSVVPRGEWGIVGLGTVGTEVASKVLANQSNVAIAEIRTPRSGMLAKLGVRRKTLDLLVAGTDVVSLHVHAGPTATPIISERELKLMKSTTVLINTSNASVVDESAIQRALNSGELAGYATDCPGDVFESPDESLVSVGKLIVTTNPLTNQIGAPQQIARFIESNLRAFQDGEPVQGLFEPVDFPAAGDPSFWSSRMSPRQD